MSAAFRFESSFNSKDVSTISNHFIVYFITLQYHKKQSFNFTAIRLGQKKSTVNYTIPECRKCDKMTGEYVSCQHCNISSIPDYNVTYACYSNSICSNSNIPGSNTDDNVYYSTITNDAVAIFNNMLLEVATELNQLVDVINRPV